MKKKLLFFLVCLITTTIYSQNNFSSIIKKEGDIMIKAMTEKNYALIINYTYPEIVKLAGGKGKLLQNVKSAMEKMEKDGYYFEEITLGEPEKIYVAGKELHCLVPETIIMNTPNGKIKATNYLLALSRDNGKKWYFIETHNLDKRNLNLIFPNFNKELIIPQKTKPVIID
jgi:hypothetical protein